MANIIKPENRRGLVGHWKYHGNVSALGSWYDISGNGNTGTLNDDAFVDNHGVNFDGLDTVSTDNDMIDLNNPSSPLLSATGEFTFMANIYNISGGLSSQGIFSQFISLANNGRFSISISGGILRYFHGNAGAHSSFSWEIDTIPTNQWSFISISRSGANLEAFINSTQYTTSYSATHPILQTGNLIGNKDTSGISYSAQPTDTFKGYINNVQIYNRDLSAEETNKLYHTTRRF